MIGCVRFWFGSVRSGDARGGSRGCWGLITRFITRFITAFGSVEARWLRGSLMDSKAMEFLSARSPTY